MTDFEVMKAMFIRKYGEDGVSIFEYGDGTKSILLDSEEVEFYFFANDTFDEVINSKCSLF